MTSNFHKQQDHENSSQSKDINYDGKNSGDGDNDNKTNLLVEQLHQDFQNSADLDYLIVESTVFELDVSFQSFLRGEDIQEHHLGRKRKSSIVGMELSQGENTNLDLDLNIAPADLDLNLAPAGNTQNERSNQWGVSSPSSQRSCMSLMEDLEVMEDSSIESSGSSGNTTTNQSPELPSLVVMGCSNCLIYVMVSEADPRCPKCKGSERLMDMFRQPAQRSRKS